ncbi:drosulfakinins [Drosophila hydei]|uniref:Drosulfakinins n=1 Tax=Drosophila hydei TaxID=7224 RepID=A0A6J1LQV5_DROHY|nr:drosulfakinins [Drosophila hydei]
MLPYKSPRRCSGALILIVLTVYLLLILPSPSHAESLDTLKEEQQRRNTEPKLESDSDALNANGAGASSSRAHIGYSNRRNQRSVGYGPRFFPISRSKIPIELELLVNNEEAERPKRFDDYGHMRFGKRGNDDQFDDYGHMRFGR